MFDTYHRTINRGPDHVSVSVTEKRAPTDQSVALLKEMEKAAEEKWKGGIRLEGCPFDAIVHHHRDYMTADTSSSLSTRSDRSAGRARGEAVFR